MSDNRLSTKSTSSGSDDNRNNPKKPSPDEIISPTTGEWITEGMNPDKIKKRSSK